MNLKTRLQHLLYLFRQVDPFCDQKEELNKITKNDFLKCFEGCKKPWHKQIISCGYYFERDKIDNHEEINNFGKTTKFVILFEHTTYISLRFEAACKQFLFLLQNRFIGLSVVFIQEFINADIGTPFIISRTNFNMPSKNIRICFVSY